MKYYSQVDTACLEFHAPSFATEVLPKLRASPMPGLLAMSKDPSLPADDPMALTFLPLTEFEKRIDEEAPFAQQIMQLAAQTAGFAQAAVMLVAHTHLNVFYLVRFS
jgi:hypothetical protein